MTKQMLSKASLARTFDSATSAELLRGTVEPYTDPTQYDHEYRRRRDDIHFYVRRAAEMTGPILELGCGSGRLMIPLLRAGREVVGVDMSAAMLAHCKQRIATLPAQARARATLRRGDFRTLDLKQKFPLVFCPFNAFQHLYARKDVELFFATVRRHLAPRGTFIFDLMHPDLRWLMRDPNKRWTRTRFVDPRTRRKMEYSTNHFYDESKQVCFMRIFYRDVDPRPPRRKKEQVIHLAHRHFYPEELLALLHYNGFDVIERFGNFDETPLEASSDQQILVCRARNIRAR